MQKSDLDYLSPILKNKSQKNRRKIRIIKFDLPPTSFSPLDLAFLGGLSSLLSRLFALLAGIVPRLDLLVRQWEPIYRRRRLCLFEQIIQTDSATTKKTSKIASGHFLWFVCHFFKAILLCFFFLENGDR